MLLADRHHGLRDSVRGLLETEFETVFMVANEASLLEGAGRLKPAIVVVDLSLSGGDMPGLLARVGARAPGAKVMVLSVHDEPTIAEAAMIAGADARGAQAQPRDRSPGRGRRASRGKALPLTGDFKVKPLAILEGQADFSLVLGGPLFKLFRRAHLSGDALELARRRMLVITGIAWLPLLLLSAFAGNALGDTVGIAFLHDIEAQVRFLIALPILIGAELVVHLRIRPIVAEFVKRRIVVAEDLPRFHEAIAATLRARNSVIGELVLLALVYTLGPWVWQSQVALGSASWYAVPGDEQMQLTSAGYWYFFVSVPIFHFILLRWYLRFFLWFWLLWRVSRLNLRLNPIHPDRAAGLGFLGASTDVFAPILFAQVAVLAGVVASQIFYAGHNLMDFRVQLAGFVAFLVVVVLVPLTVFTSHLARARREGLVDLGRLASRYVKAFDEKWVRDAMPADDALLGSGDIQSLADLGNSYAVVQEMRSAPFGFKDVTTLAATAIVPLLPLTLTIFSLEELVGHAIRVVF